MNEGQKPITPKLSANDRVVRAQRRSQEEIPKPANLRISAAGSIRQSSVADREKTVESYHCQFDDGLHWRLPGDEIDRFRDSCLTAMPAVSRFSSRIGRCFWFDLLVLTRRYDVSVHSVLHPLLDLECGEPSNGIKCATPFTRLPLKGLWHKHWFSARFMPANILAVTQRKGSMDWIWDIAEEGELLTEQLIGQIAHRMTVDAYESRYEAKLITGEWIIYLPRAGLNHFLCLGTHETGDKRLDEKIRKLCVLDFPDIAQWIDEAALAP